MATQIQFRRGTTSAHSSFTGAAGELTIDTNKDTIIVHDGSTAGGANELVTLTNTQTLTNKTLTSPTLTSPNMTSPSISGTAVTATAAELNTLDGVTATTAEINTLDGVTATTAEINKLDGVTATTTELNYVDGVTSAIQTQLDTKAPLANPALTGTATAVNLTVSGNLTVNGSTVTNNADNLTVDDALIELNNGATSNASDLGLIMERGSTGDNAFIGWDESADKFKVGTTTATGASTGNLTVTTGTMIANIEGNVTGNVTGDLTGDVTGNADTATTLATARTIAGQSFNGSANISIAPTDLTGVTATAAELNTLDGITATTTELNYVDGVTSNIQTQLNAKAATSSLGTLATLNTVNAATITDNSVGADELNVSGDGTTSQFLRSDGDGTFSWATPTDTNTTYSGGAGISLSGTTFNLDTDVRGDMYTMGRDTNDYYTVGTTTHSWFLDGAEDMRLENDGDLHCEGDVIAYSTTISDERLKTNIQVIDNALEKVNSLRGVTFHYTMDGRDAAGLIAQDVEKVLPSAIRNKKLSLKQDDGVEYKTLQYDQTIGLLVEAIKELTAEVNKLKGE